MAARRELGIIREASLSQTRDALNQLAFARAPCSAEERTVLEARKGLQYAAPVLDRSVRRAAPASVYGQRRHALAARALGVA